MHAPEMLFEYTTQVRMHEVGPDDRTPVEVLLRYFQEAAGLHAEHLGWGIEQLMKHNLVWVLTRLGIEVDRYAKAGQSITIKTWPVSKVKYIARRDFRIFADDEEIARGTTNWVMMDYDARRMKTIPDDFSNMFNIQAPDPAMEFSSRKIPTLDEPYRTSEVIARLEDLDRNGHANNAHIAAWMLEPVSSERMLDSRLKSMDIQFRAEVCRCERMKAMCTPVTSEGTMLHSIVRQSDGVEAARAQTVWRAI